MLAKVVQNKKSATMVHVIRDKHGKLHSSNEEIAKQFEQYYQSLYNIPSNPKCPQNSEKRSYPIQQFLHKYSPSPISVETALELESPIYDGRFDKAIKDMKLGKAPGPDGFPLQYYKTFSSILKPCFIAAFQSLQTENKPLLNF